MSVEAGPILFQLMIGIREAKAPKPLQLDDMNTLETAISQVRQTEQINEQQSCVRGSQPTPISRRGTC
eukprot:m.247880 g.247880  ORF g.247880 m.247880 type:complete len:68 (+) comp40276_c1_seq19:185-388(+)